MSSDSAKRLHGQVVLVTMAVRGLGRSVASALADQGAKVAVTDGNGDDAVAKEVERVVAEIGVPTALVTAGAVSESLLLGDGTVFDLSLDTWNANLELALDSAFLYSHHLLPLIARNGGGSVVHLVPAEAMRGSAGMDCRAAGGGAVVGMARGQASYWQRYGIRVNCVAVGLVENNEPEIRAVLDDEVAGPAVRQFYPFGLVSPAEVAGAVCHLLTPEGAGTDGAVIPVDRGAVAFSHLAHQIGDLPDLPSGVTVDGGQKERIRARAAEYAAADTRPPVPLHGWSPVAETLKDQVLLVTGSTHGIGRSMVEAFAALGAAVVIVGRSRDLGAELEEALATVGGGALFVPTDVSREQDIANAVTAAIERFGRLTGIVNNAAIIGGGGGADGVVSQISWENWRRLLSVNLTGTFLGCKVAAPYIAKAGGGCMINVSSAAGAHGHPGMDAYAAAKAGVMAFTRSAAASLWRYGIRVNSLVVGTIDTGEPVLRATLDDPFGETLREYYAGGPGKPLDVAMMAAHLLSSMAPFTTAASVPIENGATAVSHLPWYESDLEDVRPLRPGNIGVLERIRDRARSYAAAASSVTPTSFS